MRKVIALAAALMMVGCSGDSEPKMAKDQNLTGEISYRERILTPPGSQLKVEVVSEDGTILGMQQQEVQGGPPFVFAVDHAAGKSMSVHTSLTFAGDDSPRFQATVDISDAGQILLRGAQ